MNISLFISSYIPYITSFILRKKIRIRKSRIFRFGIRRFAIRGVGIRRFRIRRFVDSGFVNAGYSFMLASDFNSLLLLATSLAFFGRCKNLSALTLL